MLLLAQTPHHRDTETWQEREERLTLIQDTIVNAADAATCQGPFTNKEDTSPEDKCVRVWPGSKRSLAVLLVAQAVHETHLSAEVHHNRCLLDKGECDARWYYDRKQKRRVYVQQSFSPWQLKRFHDIPKEHWEEIEKGVPGTYYSAWHAARRLSSAFRACGSISGAISRYAVGNGCVWEHSSKRVQTFNSLSQKTEGELTKAIERHRTALLEKYLPDEEEDETAKEKTASLN